MLEWEGVDISPSVSVDACWHRMYASGHADTLTMRLADTEGRWDAWTRSRGDRVRYSDGTADTGSMVVDDLRSESSAIRVRAVSAPPAAFSEGRRRSWKRVRLSQLVREVCDRHGLGLVDQGIVDRTYDYVEQAGVSDLAFLERRLAYEGLGALVYDGSLVVYDERAMDSRAPSGDIELRPGMNYVLDADDGALRGSCTVTDGRTTGRFVWDPSLPALAVTVGDRITDRAEGDRWAMGILRRHNRGAATIRIESDSLVRGYAPGSVVRLAPTAAGSWDGPAFVHGVLHDYVRRRTTVWARRCISGY